MLFAHENTFMEIGVLLRTITTMRGTRISTMATRTTTIRTIITMFAVPGILNKTDLSPDKKLSGLLFSLCS